MTTRIFGSGIRRREDPRLITGSAIYTDDLTLPRMVYAAMLRSPHAHARIKKVDTSKAKAAKGVLAVFTGGDTEGALKPMPCAWLIPNSDLKVGVYPLIATEVVRYVGDIVAVVVAESSHQAYDALELVAVDYEPLPSVTDPEKATEPGAPQVHPDIPNNQAFHWVVSGGDVDAAFKNAEVVVREADRAATLDSQCHRDTLSGRPVGGRVRRAHALEHDAGPAYCPLHLLCGGGRPRGQASGHRA